MPVRDGCGIRGRHIEDGRGRGGRHLEDAHVYRVYNQIAPKFSSFSQKAWPNVRRFLKDLKPGSFVADIGCGSGRYLPINSKLTKIGIDICCPLVESARTKGHEVLVGDNLHIPFKDNTFDAVISIGVIHHFSSRSRRLAAIKELSRVLCIGGQIMIYVWAYEQKKRKFESQDVLIPWHSEKEDSNKSGQSTWSSYSSNNSLASEELSSLGSDGEGHHRLLRTISDPSSSVYTTDTLNEVNTYLKNLPQEEPKLSSRHRSNTLPSSLEGILSDEEHEDGKHGNNSGNLLARECRKLEASLRAMSSSEYFLGNGNGEFDDRENDPYIKPSFDLNGRNQNGNMEKKIFQKEERMSLGERMNTIGPRENEDEEDEIFFEVVPKLKPLEFNVDENCQTQKFPEVKKSSQTPKHEGLYSEYTESESLTFKVNEPKKMSPTNNNCTDKIGNSDEKLASPKRKLSFFQSLKESFLRLIESSPNQKVKKSSKKAEANAGTSTAGICSGTVEISDVNVNFAVREFPQSSCPAYRKEGAQPCIKSPETVLASWPSISPKSVFYKNFNSHDSENKQVENSCICNGASKHVQEDKQKISNIKKCSHDRNKLLSENESSCSNVGKNGYHGNKSTGICLSGINNHDENDFDVDEFQTARKDFMEQKSKETQGFTLETLRLGPPTTYQVYLNHLSASEKSLLSLTHSQSYLSTTFSEKVLFNESLPYDIETGGNNDISIAETYENNRFSSSREFSVSQQALPYMETTGKSDQISAHSETKTSELLKEKKEDIPNVELSRYYHVFKDGELSKMISKHIKCLRIVSSTYDHGNWCVVAEKVEAS